MLVDTRQHDTQHQQDPTHRPAPAPGQASVASEIARRYVADFHRLMDAMDLGAVDRIVARLRRARDQRAAIYLAGNGGSAATATHLANDLGKATKISGCPYLRVMCLSDNVSWLTALGNDEGYQRVFTGQLENFACPGDVLLVISCSGNSPNIVDAVEYARETGLETIGLLGFDGGRLKDLVDEAVVLRTPVGAYGPVETGHVLIGDIITTCLMADRPTVEQP